MTGGPDPEYGKVRITDDQVAYSADSMNVADGAVTAAKLASNAVETEKIANENVTRSKLGTDALCLGDTVAYDKTTEGTQTLLEGNGTGDGDKTVIIIATVTEAFADAGGSQSAFTIGETGDADKFSDGTALEDASVGDQIILHGTLSEEADLIVTGTQATGAGTGALSVTAIAVLKP